jgi:hypothetical protein
MNNFFNQQHHHRFYTTVMIATPVCKIEHGLRVFPIYCILLHAVVAFSLRWENA